eukprot:GEMP01034297.1.p1 GENE.GEMP01034297.1~~GEMP01034297.1.p1  ORF type:complete len:206 (+),score=33.41 GEMP01034297.1:436-1053(+)
MKLYHCIGARSMRILWTLKELQRTVADVTYTLITLPFPPRIMVGKEFMEINLLGTIPYFVDEPAGVHMTESCAVPVYLCDKFADHTLKVHSHEKDYGSYLNWLFHADATLTFPLTIKIRYVLLEPHKNLQQAGADYEKWHLARLRLLDSALSDGRTFLCMGRFTLADILITIALTVGKSLGVHEQWRRYGSGHGLYILRIYRCGF